MAVTRRLKEELNIRVSEHAELGQQAPSAEGIALTNHKGIVIATPSGVGGDAKSGAVIRTQEKRPAQPERVQEPEPEQPKRRGRTKARQADSEPPKEQPVRVSVTMPGFGTIPTEYKYFDTGTGLVVLGLSARSWVPTRASMDQEGRPSPAVQFDITGSRSYVYLGQEFEHDGVRCMMMLEV